MVILYSLLIGAFACLLLIHRTPYIVISGSVLLYFKNVLDKVDGSLARAKDMASRRGRFYDSLCDFIVNVLLFTAIGHRLSQSHNPVLSYLLSYLAMVFSMLQTSYFIYYHVNFITLTGKQTINRLTEDITDEDLKSEDKLTLFLQRLFLLIYGWQDKLIQKMDKYFVKQLRDIFNERWYLHKRFLSFASLFSIGTHLVLIAVCFIINKLEYYLFLNIILANLFLILLTVYHYYSVKNDG